MTTHGDKMRLSGEIDPSRISHDDDGVRGLHIPHEQAVRVYIGAGIEWPHIFFWFTKWYFGRLIGGVVHGKAPSFNVRAVKNDDPERCAIEVGRESRRVRGV